MPRPARSRSSPRSPRSRSQKKRRKRSRRKAKSSSSSASSRAEQSTRQWLPTMQAMQWAAASAATAASYWSSVAYPGYAYAMPGACIGYAGPGVSAPEPGGHGSPPGPTVSTFLDGGVEEIVEVPKAQIARVIGKRGRTIAEVRSKSGAWNVDARDQEEDPCQVKVTGPAEAVKKAREMILELSRPMSERFSDRVFVEISQGQIGKVVGTKGARIQEIERQTGVKIDIDYTCAPCRVFLTGSESQVRLTKRLLQEIAAEQLGGRARGKLSINEPFPIYSIQLDPSEILCLEQRPSHLREASLFIAALTPSTSSREERRPRPEPPMRPMHPAEQSLGFTISLGRVCLRIEDSQELEDSRRQGGRGIPRAARGSRVSAVQLCLTSCRCDLDVEKFGVGLAIGR
eukprot:s74_g15.t1